MVYVTDKTVHIVAVWDCRRNPDMLKAVVTKSLNSRTGVASSASVGMTAAVGVANS
jgi:hypothetical protein